MARKTRIEIKLFTTEILLSKPVRTVFLVRFTLLVARYGKTAL